MNGATVKLGATSLMYACQQGNEAQVYEIIKTKPTSVVERERSLKTALHYCAESGAGGAASAAVLLRAAPELADARDLDGFTPLHLAVIAGNLQLARLLLAHGAAVNTPDNEGHTPAHWATVCGELECLDLILSKGGDPDLGDMHGGRAIHYAAQMCGPGSEMPAEPSLGMAALRRLVEHAADPNLPDHHGRQPILWAASAGSSEAILVLANAGANVNSSDKDGLTALHCAASRGHRDCVETLISLCNAEADVIDNNGCSALFYAVTLGHADACTALLNHGATTSRQDRKGRTAMHCGAAKGQMETLRVVWERGGNLWTRTARGDYPLHEAVVSARGELVVWLLSLRPDAVNAPNNDGRCPLHLAAIHNNLQMCKVLLDAGSLVNPVMRTSKGLLATPLDAALHKGHRGTAKYLQLHGGVPAARLNSEAAALRGPNSRNSGIKNQQPLDNEKEKVTDDQTKSNVSQQQSVKFPDQKQKVLKVYVEDGVMIKRIKHPATRDGDERVRRRRRRRKARYAEDKRAYPPDPPARLRTPYAGSTDDEGNSTNNSSFMENRQKSQSDSENGIDESSKKATEQTTGKKVEKRSLASEDEREESEGLRATTHEVEVELHRTPELDSHREARETNTNEAELKKDDTIDFNEPMQTEIADQTNDDTINVENLEDAPSKDEQKNVPASETIDSTINSSLLQKKESIAETEEAQAREGIESTHLEPKDKNVDEHDTDAEIKSTREVERAVENVSDQGIGYAQEVKSESAQEIESTHDPDSTQETKSQKDTTPHQHGESEEPNSQDEHSETKNLENGSIQEEKSGETSKEVIVETQEEERNAEENGKLSLNEETKYQVGGAEEVMAEENIDVQTEGEDTRNESADKQEEEDIQASVEDQVTHEKDPELYDSLDEESPSIRRKSSDTASEKDQKEGNSNDLKNEDEKENTPTESSTTESVTTQKISDADKGLMESQIKSFESMDGDDIRLDAEHETADKENGGSTLVKEQKDSSTEVDNENSGDDLSKDQNEDEVSIDDGIDEQEIKKKLKENDQNSEEEILSVEEDVADEIQKNQSSNSSRKKKLKESNESSMNGSLKEVTKKSLNGQDKGLVKVLSEERSLKGERRERGRRRWKGEASWDGEELASLVSSPDRAKKANGLRSKSRIPRMCNRQKSDCDDDLPLSTVSVTQAVQYSMRKYHLERRIFHQLLELKRLQIRAGRASEGVLVKRLVDDYRRAGLMLGLRQYNGLYTFRAFEKYLYDQLRLLQSSERRIIPRLKSSDDLERLNSALRKSRAGQELLSANPALCTYQTHRCHHATHAYTGIPCAAYIRRNHHTMPKAGSFLPRLVNGDKTGELAKTLRFVDPTRPLTLELSHGTEKQVITLPTEKLDKSKRYFVTFTIKTGNPKKTEGKTGAHVHASSV